VKFTAFLDVTPCGLVTVGEVLDFKVERIMGWKQGQQDPPKCTHTLDCMVSYAQGPKSQVV